MRTQLSCPTSLAPALALALALPAQSPTVVTNWPGTAFETAIAGTFLGDLRQCALVSRSGQLSVVFEPARFRGFSAVSAMHVMGTSPPFTQTPMTLTGVTGMVGYRPTGLPTTSGDVLLIATSTGVWRASFASAGTESKLYCWSALNPSWYGARLLTARTLPSGDIEVAARNAAGDRALTAIDSNGAITSVDSWHSANPITAVHLVDWDHNGMIDPLVVTTAGMGITAPGGELVLDCTTNLASARTMPIQFSGNDQVGIISNGPAYPLQSVVWGSRDCVQLARVDLPDSGFTPVGQLTTGAATYDIQADGTSEVLVSRVGDFKYLYVKSDGTVSIIDVLPGATGQPANNQCPFFWRDFDYDGQPDLLAFWNTGNGVQVKSMVFRPSIVAPAHPPIARTGFSYSGPLVKAASYDGTKLYLQFRPDYWADGREVRVTVWRQPNPYASAAWEPTRTFQSPEPYLDPQAVELAIPFGPTTANNWSLGIGTTAGWNASEQRYLDVRLVDTASNEVLVAEVDAFCVFPEGSKEQYDNYVAAHPEVPIPSYLDSMLAYMLARRESPTSPYAELKIGDTPEPIGSTTQLNMGGFPLGGIVLQVKAPPPNPVSTPVIIILPPLV